jgi:hypothetical protein
MRYLRLRLAPQSAIALAARVKRIGEDFLGERRELCLFDHQPGEEAPYERLARRGCCGRGTQGFSPCRERSMAGDCASLALGQLSTSGSGSWGQH